MMISAIAAPDMDLAFDTAPFLLAIRVIENASFSEKSERLLGCIFFKPGRYTNLSGIGWVLLDSIHEPYGHDPFFRGHVIFASFLYFMASLYRRGIQQ